jgi:hypothetical protein
MSVRRRAALLAWLVFAFVTWSVIFDYQVRVESARFVKASVERYQQGQPPVTIDAGFRPRVSSAAGWAAVWGSLVLAVGASAIHRAARRESEIRESAAKQDLLH